jgi:epoxyqueuosine reductase
MLAVADIKQLARQIGFDLAGIAPAEALREFLPRWLAKGFGGEMHYLTDPRRADPRRVLPSVNAIIVVALVYNTAYPYSADLANNIAKDPSPTSGSAPLEETGPRGWISRYAWGKDYHDIVRGKLEQLRTAIEQVVPGVETRAYVDTGPVVERAFARLSGVGWMGKNTCLINERKGSWFFLGVILTNLKLEFDVPAPDRCGSCTRCLEACPTGALLEPYLMDASRCISYFNIEHRGAIPEQFRTAIGTNVFGCDICQDVCPWNDRPMLEQALREEQVGVAKTHRHAATSEVPEFQPMQVAVSLCEVPTPCAAEAAPDAASTEKFSLFNPPLEALASMTEEDFRRIFARSPIKRAKYGGWLRNLCVAMGNSGDRRFIPWLKSATGHSDCVVREHAAWALERLQEGRQAV